MENVTILNVLYNGAPVGTLAETAGGKIAFQYDKSWIENGFSISPFSLPLGDKVFISDKSLFDGLYGVFDDSLPDGWGRLLTDRMLMKNNIAPESVTPLTRLAIVGKSGMGALEYEPEIIEDNGFTGSALSLDELAAECNKIMNDRPAEHLDDVFRLGGSSGGARPKAFLNYDCKPWIVKFPSHYDSEDIGKQEYDYNICAGKCGIEIPEVHLFDSAIWSGYFGCARFDRIVPADKSVLTETSGTSDAATLPTGKLHMVSVAALLETSHRYPNLDYSILFKLTDLLAGDAGQLLELYRRMCFNVFAHNRDDHSRNFSFLYDEAAHAWRLTPAYDMTYSNSIGGEHATTVNGNGRDPGLADVAEVGKRAGISASKAKKIAEEIGEIVNSELRTYLKA